MEWPSSTTTKMWNTPFLPQTDTEACVHTCTQTLPSPDPLYQTIQHSSCRASVGLQSDNREDSTSDSVSSDGSFWSAAKSFQNGMQALGNWEWVLWAIRYLVDGKINPHLLLVIEKEIYFFPYKESERTRPLSVTMATQLHYCSVHPVTMEDLRKKRK